MRKTHCQKEHRGLEPVTFHIMECGLKILASGQILHSGHSKRMADSLPRPKFEEQLVWKAERRPQKMCSKCVTAVRGHEAESIFPAFLVNAPLPKDTATPTRRGVLGLSTKVKTGLSPDIEKALMKIAGVEELPEVAPWLTYDQLSALAVFISSRAWLAGESSGNRFPRGEGG